MTADDLLKALYGVAIAALGIVSIVLGVVARYVPDMIRTFLEGRKLISLERAGNISARATEESSRSGNWSPSGKQHAAQELLKSIAPNAVGKVDAAQLEQVVKAGVQSMRASMPTTDGILPIPVTVVGSSIPPAPKMPKGFGGET